MRMQRCNRALNRVWVMTLFMAMSVAGFAQNQSYEDGLEEDGVEVKGDSGVVEIHEVERGFYVGLEYGANYMLSTDISGSGSTFAGEPLGQRLKFNIGYDIANNIGLDFFVLGMINQGDVSAALAQSNQLTGDVFQLIPGLSLKFSFITKKHTFVYARGAAGLNFWMPGEMVRSNALSQGENSSMGIYVEGALGVEYYTKLRHVSVGVEAGLGLGLQPGAMQAFLTFPVKYTF